jgi:2'-5' RNA ligase
MSNQSDLFGAPAQRPTDRFFLGTFLAPEAAAQASQLAHRLRNELGLKGTPVALDRLHSTLFHLGDYDGTPGHILEAAKAAAAALSSYAFPATFDRVASFDTRSNNRPLVLLGGEGVAGLVVFQRALGTELTRAGLARFVKAPFTPHVTLLYDGRLVPERRIEPIGWAVRELVLVHSLLGKTQHIPLGRWPLREAS